MSRVGDYFKRVGRKAIPIHEKYITRYARPVVSTGLSYLFSPVVGTAFNAATHHAHQAVAGVTQRAEGKHGLEARQKARAQASRTSIYGEVGVGLGSVAAGITTAAVGGNFFAGAAGGVVGAPLFTSGPTLFKSAAPALTNLGELGTPIGGAVAPYGTQLADVGIKAAAIDASAGAEGEALFVSNAAWKAGGLGGTVIPGSVAEVAEVPAGGSTIWGTLGDIGKAAGLKVLGNVVDKALHGGWERPTGTGQGGQFPGGGGGDIPGAGGNIMDWLGGGKQEGQKDNSGLWIAAAVAVAVFAS